ncbi:hypothetical protein ASF27_10095 [Methylobacterium sp. Leaf102]|uniref:DUF4174 domain-containing protein n=1 Tax=Methylobacterium sp. Leaf102 TaxID=1736253 RepID=UPI0006F76907|nr:DUF4174 domain-containing protein [Methylobacterium sp. Leaf102]KQP24457.1 hypothetical protein ASF27_10095 [Methylobacterium sp. Leaf102]
MVRGLLLMGMVLASGTMAAENPLAAHRWKARVVVMSAPGLDDPHLMRQRALLAAVPDGVRDRDLVVLEAVGTTAEARGLRARLGLPDASFRVVLVGKDGGTKLDSATPLPAETLFSTIDAMPMRRDEMGR